MIIKYNLIIFLIYILNLNLIKCGENKPVYITIFDHHPSKNPDFEADITGGVVRTGMVNSVLGDRIEYIAMDGQMQGPFHYGIVNNQSTFNSWFYEKQDVNIALSIPFTFTRSPIDESKVVYDSDAFFPIDNKGWDAPGSNLQRYNDSKDYHNFHFCLHLKSRFTYKTTETFKFLGDDDVWVYIDNQLVVDLGGIHQAADKTIYLRDKLGDKSRIVSFDFFYCERHTISSALHIETDIELVCGYYDYCGVCEGNGETCCNSKTCDDSDPCTIEKCPPPTTKIPNLDKIKDYCIRSNVSCPDPDKCTNNFCNKEGKCESKKIICEDRGKCVNSQCDPQVGCKYQNVQCSKSDKCTLNFCDQSSGQCISNKTICDDGNPCTDDSCDVNIGCQHTAKKCDSGNKCNSDTCENGQCKSTPIEGCIDCDCPTYNKNCQIAKCVNKKCVITDIPTDDSNLCTKDECLANGTISHTKTQCNNEDACILNLCDSKSGKCVSTPALNCDDSNICTVDTCSKGKCENKPLACDDNNPCTIDSCDIVVGCVHKPVECTNPSPCKVGTCNKNSGKCEFKDRVCSTDDFCSVAQCDPKVGCIVFDKTCVPSNPSCEKGICNREKQKCESRPFNPLPFKCQSAGVKAGVAVGAAAIAGIVIGGAVALGLAVFGGKKGYDYWKSQKNQKMTSSTANPLYEGSPNNAQNPLYENTP